jgi:hypothetical protein
MEGAMTCNCADDMNKMIADNNARLTTAFRVVDGHLIVIPTLIASEKIITSMRSKMPLIVPTYCPFCGVRYEKKADDAQTN